MNRPASAPQCIAIIMDGNRRWAKQHGRESWEGHAAGNKKFKEVLRWAHAREIQHVIVYAFSTENWNRSDREVGSILDLARAFFKDEITELIDSQFRVRFAGDRSRFPDDIQSMMRDTEATTQTFTKMTVMIAASYGGRAEILAAAKLLSAQGVLDPDEATFQGALWTSNFPDPDLLIRTGGERRLSNFLPWQSTYSELFFTDTLWPAFTEDEFAHILADYAARKRNFGT